MGKADEAADALLGELLGRVRDKLTDQEADFLGVTVIDAINRLATSVELFVEQFERLVDIIEIPMEANYPGAFMEDEEVKH